MICLDCGRWFEEDSRYPGIPVCKECGTDIALSEDEEEELARMELDESQYSNYLCEARSAGASPLTLSEWLTVQERIS